MEEESVHYFRISSGDRCESMAGKIDGFGKIDFMIKRIKKRGFEGLWIKVISGEIEGLESFHSLSRKNKVYSTAKRIYIANCFGCESYTDDLRNDKCEQSEVIIDFESSSVHLYDSY